MVGHVICSRIDSSICMISKFGVRVPLKRECAIGIEVVPKDIMA